MAVPDTTHTDLIALQEVAYTVSDILERLARRANLAPWAKTLIQARDEIHGGTIMIDNTVLDMPGYGAAAAAAGPKAVPGDHQSAHQAAAVGPVRTDVLR